MQRKEEMIRVLTEYATLKMGLQELDKYSGCIFSSVYEDAEIQVTNRGFEKMIESIQPITHYNPNWTDRYEDIIEGYFHITLLGKQWKVFTLMDKEVEE